jgi:hypothetical protein
LLLKVPRVDISAPANAIEYHPALLAHVDEAAAGGGANSVLPIRAAPLKAPPAPKEDIEGSDSDDSDLSDDDMLSDDSLVSEESDPEILASMSPSEKAELEKFGADYTGPKLSDGQSARLLPLLLHASSCPCR